MVKKQSGGLAEFGPITNISGLLDNTHNPMLADVGSSSAFMNLPTPFSNGAANANTDSFSGFSDSIKNSVLPSLGGGAKKAKSVGGNAKKPTVGGSAKKPTVGGSAKKPTIGGSAKKPTIGGSDAKKTKSVGGKKKV